MSRIEEVRRLIKITEVASKDSTAPNEYIRREIQAAVQRGSPFINHQNSFVVLGIDGFDGSIFPVGSFSNPEEAFACKIHKEDEEHLYANGDDIKSTFHVFTRKGLHVDYNLGQEE